MATNTMFGQPTDDESDEAVSTPVAAAIDSGDDFKPSDELFEQLKARALECKEHAEPWWEESKEYYDYYAGHQWRDEDKQVLESQMRPVITFNRIAPVIDSLIGLELNNREQVQFYPRTMGDVKINELYTSAAMWVRQQCDAEDEESDAFMDLAVSGMGWTDTHLVTDENAQGSLDVKIDRVPGDEMGWDPNSKKRNLADARMLCRFRDIPFTEAEGMFPDADPNELHATWASDLRNIEHLDQPHKYLFNDDSAMMAARRRDKVTIVEIQWWEKRDYWRIADPMTGEEVHFDDKKYREALKRFKELSKRMFEVTGQTPPPIQGYRYKRKVYRRAFLGSVILKLAPLPCPYAFSYQCMTGKRDKTKRHWFGLARAMKDPQEWANKWLSQLLHIVNSNAKGGLMAPKSAFDNWREVENNYSRPDFITWVKDASALNAIKQRDQVQFPAGIYQLMEFAISSIRDANGFNLELLGMADRDQAASLEYQRKQAGMTVLAQFFNALRLYRKRQGRCLLYMIQKWLGDGRLIRITTDKGDQQNVPLLTQDNEEVLEYDVIVDEAPASPNQKEQVWSMLLKAIPMLQNAQLPPQVWGEILRYSPLPEGLSAKIIESMNTPPDPKEVAHAEALKQIFVAQATANLNATNAAAADDMADVVAKRAKAAKDIADAEAISAEALAQRLNAMEQLVRGQRGIIQGPPPAMPQMPPMTPPSQSPFAGAMT